MLLLAPALVAALLVFFVVICWYVADFVARDDRPSDLRDVVHVAEREEQAGRRVDVAAGNGDFEVDKGSQDSIESDTQWHTWTLTLGFPVMGITLEASDGTDVNAASASRDRRLILSGDDSGHVKLFNGPATCRWAAHRAYWGHSSHCLGVSFLAGGGYVASCGGRDAAVLLWKIVPKALGVDDGADGEEIVKPPSARPAWYEGCELHSTIDILRKAAPMA